MSQFENLQIIKMLGRSNASVFLVFCKDDQKTYAMKVYPIEKRDVSMHYYIEARFNWVSHPNVISIKDVQPLKKNIEGIEQPVSYILMEAAPYGDFSSLIRDVPVYKDERLVRTYFRQLIQGLEYLHSNGLAHLDLKPQNLLLGDKYTLKIADFDCSHPEEDAFVSVGGTRGYRAPEIANDTCTNPKAADIYSAGVILFALMTGYVPYDENKQYKGVNLWELLQREDPLFWELHSRHAIDDSFKELFMSMVKADPNKRPSLDAIKKSRWCTGPVYNQKELCQIMSKLLSKSKI